MRDYAYFCAHGADCVPADGVRAIDIERCIADAEAKDVEAVNSFAMLLEEGAPVDMKRAVALYMMAIDEDTNAPAMNNLSFLLSGRNRELNKDSKRALDLYERAIAIDADEHAMHNLAPLIASGR